MIFQRILTVTCKQTLFERPLQSKYHRRRLLQWLLLLHNFIQLSLNSGSAQVQTLLAAGRRFTMLRMSDNGPGWK